MELSVKAKLTAAIMEALNNGLTMDDIKKVFQSRLDLKRIRMGAKSK